MRFRFCGDLDCPDWVLAEIATLTKVSSVRMKLVCAQVVQDLLGNAIDYEKVQKLTSDAKFESGDIKACIAALSFILTSAAKYSVDGESLSNELQQLGLPKEHSTSLCKSYSDNLQKLQQQFLKESLRLSCLESVDWRVDYILSSSELKEVNEPYVQIRFKIRDPNMDQMETVTVTLTSDKFRVFLSELKQAQGVLDSLDS